ncbi:acref/envcd operon repressor (TetR-family transcriptional regulator) [Escherichia coli]|nr:acref/envcd operon repressor (TetR-family transcriptional regulator) [Escherichia coli]
MAKRTKAEALKTRQELIETAIAQFAQHGVSKTTLNDIADAANVTRGAIYWHFENKTQLFNEMWLQQPSLRELIQEHLTAGLEHDWICPYISRHLLSLNPLQARCRRYSRGER